MTGTSYSFGVLALVAAISALAFAARRVRRAFLPSNTGALGVLTDVVVGLSLLLAVLEITGSFGLFSRWVVVVAVPAVAVIVGVGARTTAPTSLDRRRVCLPSRPIGRHAGWWPSRSVWWPSWSRSGSRTRRRDSHTGCRTSTRCATTDRSRRAGFRNTASSASSTRPRRTRSSTSRATASCSAATASSCSAATSSRRW